MFLTAEFFPFIDASGAVRSVGGNFKERLRKFGGLDAIFDVAVQSYSRMKVRIVLNMHGYVDYLY